MSTLPKNVGKYYNLMQIQELAILLALFKITTTVQMYSGGFSVKYYCREVAPNTFLQKPFET